MLKHVMNTGFYARLFIWRSECLNTGDNHFLSNVWIADGVGYVYRKRLLQGQYDAVGLLRYCQCSSNILDLSVCSLKI